MNSPVETIAIARLALSFLPALAVLVILYRWSLETHIAVYAMLRMLIQLLFIGYFLAFIFRSDRAAIVVGVLAIMLFTASWISLRPLRVKTRWLYAKATGSMAAGSLFALLLVTQSVLRLDPWFLPRYMIPLAGMLFANSINTISLAAERFVSERQQGATYDAARRAALQASLIPLINSLFAAGLVSFPGMMTGQILSGIAPTIAARYQIMVMSMVFGAGGISAAFFLRSLKQDHGDLLRQP